MTGIPTEKHDGLPTEQSNDSDADSKRNLINWQKYTTATKRKGVSALTYEEGSNQPIVNTYDSLHDLASQPEKRVIRRSA